MKATYIKDSAGKRYRIVKSHGGWAILVYAPDGTLVGDPRVTAVFRTKKIATAVAEAMVEWANRMGGR